MQPSIPTVAHYILEVFSPDFQNIYINDKNICTCNFLQIGSFADMAFGCPLIFPASSELMIQAC